MILTIELLQKTCRSLASYFARFPHVLYKISAEIFICDDKKDRKKFENEGGNFCFLYQNSYLLWNKKISTKISHAFKKN